MSKPKYLKSTIDGYIYPYTDLLSKRGDMVPCNKLGELSAVPQQHLTVKQKLEAGLPVTEEDRKAHPELFVGQNRQNSSNTDQNDEYINPPDEPAQATTNENMVSVDVDSLDDMNRKQLLSLAEKLKLKVDKRSTDETLRALIQSVLVDGN